MSDSAKRGAEASRFGLRQLIPIAAAAMAILFIWLGLKQYGFWNPMRGPLPGFFPVIIAAAMLLISVAAFFQSFSEPSPVWPVENWLVVLSVALILGASFLIGMVPSIALYVVLWLRAFERCTWKTTLITTAVIMAIVIGCFVLWLGVPFPKGIIFTAIFG